MYVTELRTSISRYPCGYELYQKDANELLVNVKVPAGSRFQNEYIDIRFKENKPKVFVGADVIFAGAAAPTEHGASHVVLRMGEITLIDCISSEQALKEVG